MGLQKRRPCGAAADINELEYISALHQTGKDELREDGSIQACDIVAFLMSRHGIEVTEEEVLDKIIGTFGQRTVDSRSDIDLIQLLALLLIPLLLKAKQSLDQAQQASNTIRRQSGTCLHRQKGDSRWPDADIIESVLRMMLHDATGDATLRPLTKELIRQILRFYGEGEASNNEQLLDEMVLAVTPDSITDIEGEPILLDQHSFAHGLTHDVQHYNIDFENSMTTNFHDVFSDEQKGDVKEGNSVKTVRTLSCIDYTADTFRSKSYVVILWVAWILTYFSYLQSQNVLTMAKLQCDEFEFGCTLAQGILNWLVIMFQLSVLGSIFIIAASAGNVKNANPFLMVVGICATLIFIVLPFFLELSVGVVSTKKSREGINPVLYHLSVICGFILLIDPVMNIFQRLLPEKSSLLMFVQKHMDNTRLEAAVKRAASFKMNRLVRNACDVHKAAELDGGIGQGLETRYGIAMLAFAKASDQKEELMNFRQTWKRIWNRELFEDEGIWLTTHVLAGNLAQVTVCVLLATLFAIVYSSELFQQGLDHLDKLVPGYSQRWRLLVPLFFGISCGQLTIISIISKYIPSSINTILQFRSGGFETLKGNSFLKLRYAVDNSSLLFGSIFWGTFYTSVIVGFFFMILLGILMWPDFAQIVGVLFANIIGIGLTVMLKWIVLRGYRRVTQQGYYRKNVVLSNVVNIILESWNLALGIGYMLIRGLYFILAATMFIGRVDVPFLSQDACFVGPFELDSFPLIFRKDLLSHDAHRHPYIERLGVMYMLKLRHDDFGSRAGTHWRLLFIYALLPWMRKYRRNDESLVISEFKFAANRMWTGRMPIESEQSFESSKQEAGVPSELEMLRAENNNLRMLLFGHGKRSHLTSSCPPAPSVSGVPINLQKSVNTA
mmetsp:Transcript_3787/g.6451  ORF Transcript_3787/g.6451 Transcript_3787/m.6451 type:complete len:895 (-) Transcript_3787:79-2763(-)